ncbi:MAG: hypothetical protein OXF79_10775 [Chloroflexi bacterium]|nr:hypothetical protein [Chloroflexota bacterium]
MSTAMNAVERARFLQALREDPDFRDEVRSLLLGDELLQLPERFAEFAAYVHDFIEEQKTFNAGVTEFITDQKQFNEDQKALNRRVERDLGILKGNAARRLLQLHHDTILEIFQLDLVRTLGRDDLSRMVRNSGIATQIEFGQRRSFYAADLVLEGTDAEGITHYVAAEGSFTADRRDTDRAHRNAEFLTKFTGCTAHPMVASVSNDHEVQELVDAGAIGWFQLDARELEAD